MSEVSNIKHRWPQTNISNKKMYLYVYQFILYINLSVLTPSQNMFKMSPQILGVENTALKNSDMVTLQSPSRILYFIYTGSSRF